MNTSRAFLDEARHRLAKAHEKIVHCLSQLNDDQVNWRPFEQANSLANIILHLCGNLRQWCIAGLTNQPDTRHRAFEFSDRKRYTRNDLLQRLEQTVREADQTLANLDPGKILEPRRIQAFDVRVLSAIFDTVTHFTGHSQEIIYITRLQLRENYKYKFVPTTEQGRE
jgi:hypothetical protein